MRFAVVQQYAALSSNTPPKLTCARWAKSGSLIMWNPILMHRRTLRPTYVSFETSLGWTGQRHQREIAGELTGKMLECVR
jgi:hypothetical protein